MFEESELAKAFEVAALILIRLLRAFALFICIAAFAGICAADELERYAVWVTGHVLYDKKEGLMFRADNSVQGNTSGNLVYLAIPEDLAKTFGPICYRAAEKHTQLRLYGAFLPHSGSKELKHPSVNFLIWKIHMPTDPDELPPDQKVFYGRGDKIPGYKIVPKER